MNQQIELDELLAQLPQPAFAVQDGKVLARNRAAAQLVSPGAPVQSLLGESEYESFSDGVLAMHLPIGDVTVQRLRQVDLFRVQPEPDSDRLAYLSQMLRVPLTDLFSSARQLFPFLESDEDPTIQHFTAKMTRAFYRMLRMCGALSDVERLMREDTVLPLERQDLTAFFSELFDEAASLCETAGLHLRLQMPKGQHFARFDAQQLERAVLNLLSNAMRYSAPGGEILLRLSVADHVARITVQDHGEGIPAGMLSSVFERYRMREPVGDARWGLGLGLPLARAIALRHGGAMMLSSEEGAGTTVTLSMRTDLPAPSGEVHSPLLRYDYTGGYRHSLTELADALPDEVYDTRNLD